MYQSPVKKIESFNIHVIGVQKGDEREREQKKKRYLKQ